MPKQNEFVIVQYDEEGEDLDMFDNIKETNKHINSRFLKPNDVHRIAAVKVIKEYFVEMRPNVRPCD